MTFTLFSISSFVIFVASIGFAALLYLRNRASETNRRWLLVSIAIGLWGLALGGVTAAHSSDTAFRWQYLLDIAGIFVPVTYLFFVSSLTNIRPYGLLAGSVVTAFALATLSITPFFKAGMTTLYGFNWIEPGPLYIIFPAYFAFVIGASVWLLVRAIKLNPDDRTVRAQMRNMLLASVIGFGGGFTNFLPQLFNVYPFGNYFIILYVFFMSYGVLRYQLFEAKVVSAQLFSGALVLLFFFKVLLPTSLNEFILNLFLLVFVIFFSIFLVKGVYREVAQRERIERLARDLEAANARLREIDKQKSEFVSFASHQLRSPLTAIKGYASLILEGDMGEIAKPVRDAVDVIAQSSETLANVVNDYLNISRIELGTMKYAFEPLDLKEIAQASLAELAPNFERAGVTHSFVCDDTKAYRVNADKDKLKQVTVNLIDNSMKYSPHGQVTVSVERDETKGVARFTVSDNGVGMSKETLAKIFNKFTRADNANKVNIRGTGLGLYVAKEIVDAHKGKIWAESEGEGKGSRFIVELALV